MDSGGEILGNTGQYSISVSDHLWPTYFQAFGRCYRKEKCPEAICKRTTKTLCRCLWQARSRCEIEKYLYKNFQTGSIDNRLLRRRGRFSALAVQT